MRRRQCVTGCSPYPPRRKTIAPARRVPSLYTAREVRDLAGTTDRRRHPRRARHGARCVGCRRRRAEPCALEATRARRLRARAPPRDHRPVEAGRGSRQPLRLLDAADVVGRGPRAGPCDRARREAARYPDRLRPDQPLLPDARDGAAGVRPRHGLPGAPEHDRLAARRPLARADRRRPPPVRDAPGPGEEHGARHSRRRRRRHHGARSRRGRAARVPPAREQPLPPRRAHPRRRVERPPQACLRLCAARHRVRRAGRLRAARCRARRRRHGLVHGAGGRQARAARPGDPEGHGGAARGRLRAARRHRRPRRRCLGHRRRVERDRPGRSRGRSP